MTPNNWQRCVDFHGHSCPGLAIGFRACEAVMERLHLHFSQDEELVCVTENDACCVDAIQVLTGCTIGKGNLIMRTTGKTAFSFFCRASGAKLRVVFKQGCPADMDLAARQEHILNAPLADLFDFKEPACEPPSPARIFTKLACVHCGEYMTENMARLQDGKTVCLDCLTSYSRGW